MIYKSKRKFERLLTGVTIALIFMVCLPEAVFSVVKFDGSAVARGRTDTLSGPTYTIEAGMGTQKGNNLFHSFTLFNIGTGETALFTDTGATGSIRNVIGRVTGGSPSSIDGTIASTIPGSNLFLMNPYGFMFGPNAWISVPGSFHVTTADYLKMADGAKFYADLGKTSVLSAEPVTAFGFLTSSPAPITVQGSYLLGEPSTILSFVGGDITVQDDVAWPAWIEVPGGQINLVSVRSPGEAFINQTGEAPSVDVSSFTSLGSIKLQRLTDTGYVNIMVDGYMDGSNGSGTIVVRGGQFQMTTSFLNANNYGAAPSNPVAVDLAITGDMLMQQDSQILAQNFGPASGGNIQIKAGNLQMQEMAMIAAASLGPGNAGNISVNVDNNLTLLPITEISSNTVDTGRGGNISITAKNISISADQYSIDNDLFTGIAAQTRGAGVGGDITIRADNIQVLNAGAISTNLMPLPEEYGGPTFPSGTGGNIDLVTKNIDVSGMIIQESTGVDFHSRIESRLMTEYATGAGGDVLLKSDRMTLGDGGYIGTYLTYGSPGKAGNITVNADTLILNPQGKIESSSVLGTGTEASAGDITIVANNIKMVGIGKGSEERINFTGFRSDTLDGTGGNIDVNAQTISMSKGARIMSDSSGLGTGGNIAITANLLQLAQGSTISAKSSSSGYAGNITLDVGTLESDLSTISTEAATTDGGDITVNARDIVILRDSEMTTSVNGGPETTGGNIKIDPRFVILDDSRIMANAYEGHGGSVSIIASVFLASPESVVSASSQLGIDGTVDIQSPIQDISGTLAPVSGSYLQTAEVVRDRCVARIKGSSQSSLTISGRDGLPPRPGMVLPALVF